jgi:alpha-D-ribose 1-methylphosphonate 5-triphosphate synthase subunit PhnH
MSSGNDNIAASSRLKPGFAEPVFESQSAFRAVLDAMSYAGRIHTVETGLNAPSPLHAATAAVALTLFDFDTPVWLDAGIAASEVPAFLKFHCGCPVTAATAGARFGVVADAVAMPSLDDFDIGEDKYPDRSATLIVQVASLTDGPVTTWKGPGINGSIDVRIGGLPAKFWESWALNHELYPLGLDLIFVCGHDIIGLPRGIKVEA